MSALFLALFLAAGCLLRDPTPEVIVVRLSGEGEVSLLTSTNFAAVQNDDTQAIGVQLFDVDSAVVSLPYDRSWDIRSEQRFFLLGAPIGEDAIQIGLRVVIDGREIRNVEINSAPGRPLRFVYRFNQPTLIDFEII